MTMGFEETMAGTYTANDGTQSPMMFTVKATMSGPQALVSGEEIGLDGTITIGDIVRQAPATGSLAVRLLQDRQLVYKLAFSGDDGTDYRYEGRKDVSVLRLLDTMTTLRGNVYRQDDVIGNATLTFSLRDVPELVASFVKRFGEKSA
jgi:hypothetical protein